MTVKFKLLVPHIKYFNFQTGIFNFKYHRMCYVR